MAKNAYRVEGDFQMGRIRQTFALEVVSADEAAAREKAYTELGSRHGVNRRQVKVAGVRKVAAADVTSNITRKLLEKA